MGHAHPGHPLPIYIYTRYLEYCLAQNQFHSLTLPRRPRKCPDQPQAWQRGTLLNTGNQSHTNRVRLLVQSFESQVFRQVNYGHMFL